MTENILAVAQINVHVGNFESNTAKIIQSINKAKQKGAQIVIFPELAVCGYPPRDFLEFDFFIKACEKSIHKIAQHSQGIHVIVGSPSLNPSVKGKSLFNSAYHIYDCKIEAIYHKTLLPNYDVFDEYRYFEPNTAFKTFQVNGHVYGVAICEDLWNTESNSLYTITPVEELKKLGAQTIINIAASPFSFKQQEQRVSVLKENALKYNVNIVYCNHIGAQTELIFDGNSFFMDFSGKIVNQAESFKEDLLFSNAVRTRVINENKMSLIHDALLLGIKDYFQKLGFKKAIVGLSGGIDSAVTFALAAQALGSENVVGVLMPSEFSSDHSIQDALDLAHNLNAVTHTLPIQNVFKAYQKELGPVFEGLPFNIAEENLQARSRGVLLMAMANKFGYILLNTSNKSEAAVGYGTLYGDMNGGISVLGDLYKTEVFELAKYINKDKEIIPINSIVKPPSAELRPDQKDSDSLPDYAVLDNILFQYIELRKGELEIIETGLDSTLVKRVLSLVNLNEYKRYQTPPTLRISSKAFGMGRRMPIVAKY